MAFSPTRIPIKGSMRGMRIATSTPAAAASADPSANVKAMMRSVLIPINFADCKLKDTARIARPVFVRYTINCNTTINAIPMTSTMMSALLMLAPPTRSMLRLRKSSGKNFGSAPKQPARHFQARETPIAVISAVNREYLRTGRYARRSIITPSAAQIAIASSITTSAVISDGSRCRRRVIHVR